MRRGLNENERQKIRKIGNNEIRRRKMKEIRARNRERERERKRGDAIIATKGQESNLIVIFYFSSLFLFKNKADFINKHQKLNNPDRMTF